MGIVMLFVDDNGRVIAHAADFDTGSLCRPPLLRLPACRAWGGGRAEERDKRSAMVWSVRYRRLRHIALW